MRVSATERTLNYAILIGFSLIVLTPVASILAAAFGPANASAAREGAFHPENFATAWVEGRFGQYMGTSVLVAVIVVSLSVLLSILSGYAFGAVPGFFVSYIGALTVRCPRPDSPRRCMLTHR